MLFGIKEFLVEVVWGGGGGGARSGAVEELPYKLESRGLIPDRVMDIFYWLNASGRTSALGSTQPLREMSTRIFPEG